MFVVAEGRIKRSSIWSNHEKARIRLMMNNSIFQRRYPSYEEGRSFMDHVDDQRREELFSYAEEVTEHIVFQWEKINPSKPIAVVLFGSVATGLVKRIDHPNPSNIDLAVIGEFSEEERVQLFTGIREKRDEIQTRVLQRCSKIDSDEKNPGNVGVFIQQTQKLVNDGYKCALEYLSSNATVLYDPENIWKPIEEQALAFYIRKMRKSRRYPYLWKDEV